MLLRFFSDESYCELEIVKDIFTVEMSNVRLVLPPLVICGGTNCTAKI